MNESKISVRYARALFMSAKEQAIVDRVRDDMEYLLKLSSLDDVRELLESPVIANRVKRETLRLLVKGKIHELTYNLVQLTITNNRDSYLPGISRCFIDQADRFNGITKTKLTTTVTIDKALLERLRAMIEENTGTKILFEQAIDPEITGGFLLKVEDKFIDASVRTQLRNIKKELTKD
ncbi:MAG: ATP synthase F1 subunit delta [Bacteroidia bacterium]|nr:MAG: ATP synthase F1 subunit delta [Bacteroidia bacterium]